MSRRIIIALSCGALGLGGAFVAGCGGDDTTDSTSTRPDAATTTPATPGSTKATPGSTKAGTTNIVMQNNFFSPDKITVKVGEKIHWTNNDPYDHNVTATKGENFKSGDLTGGKTFDYTADKAGTIKYICTIHSGQKGEIVVTN